MAEQAIEVFETYNSENVDLVDFEDFLESLTGKLPSSTIFQLKEFQNLDKNFKKYRAVIPFTFFPDYYTTKKDSGFYMDIMLRAMLLNPCFRIITDKIRSKRKNTDLIRISIIKEFQFEDSNSVFLLPQEKNIHVKNLLYLPSRFQVLPEGTALLPELQSYKGQEKIIQVFNNNHFTQVVKNYSHFMELLHTRAISYLEYNSEFNPNVNLKELIHKPITPSNPYKDNQSHLFEICKNILKRISIILNLPFKDVTDPNTMISILIQQGALHIVYDFIIDPKSQIGENKILLIEQREKERQQKLQKMEKHNITVNVIKQYLILIKEKFGVERYNKLDLTNLTLDKLHNEIVRTGSQADLAKLKQLYNIHMKNIDSATKNTCEHLLVLKQMFKEVTRKSIADMLKKLERFYVLPITNTKFIKCKKCNLDIICPHIHHMILLKNKNLSFDAIYFHMKKFISEHNLTYHAYFCHICGEKILDQTSDKFEDSTYGEAEDSIKHYLWVELTRLYTKFNFVYPIPQAKFINDAISECYPVVRQFESLFIKRKMRISDEADPRLNLYALITLFAYIMIMHQEKITYFEGEEIKPSDKVATVAEKLLTFMSKRYYSLLTKIENITNEYIVTRFREAYQLLSLSYTPEDHVPVHIELFRRITSTPMYKFLLTIAKIHGMVPILKCDPMYAFETIFKQPLKELSKKLISTNDRNKEIQIFSQYIFTHLRFPEVDRTSKFAILHKDILNLQPIMAYQHTFKGGGTTAESDDEEISLDPMSADIQLTDSKLSIELKNNYRSLGPMHAVHVNKARKTVQDYKNFLDKIYSKELGYHWLLAPYQYDYLATLFNYLDVYTLSQYQSKNKKLNIIDENLPEPLQNFIKNELILIGLSRLKLLVPTWKTESINPQMFVKEEKPLSVVYDEKGNKHKYDIYVFKNKIEIPKSKIKTDRLPKMEFVDLKCSICGVLQSQAGQLDQKKVKANTELKFQIDTFYIYFSIRCPEGGLHEYNKEKCKKCGLTFDIKKVHNKLTDNSAKNYYDKYQNKFNILKEKIYTESQKNYISKIKKSSKKDQIKKVNWECNLGIVQQVAKLLNIHQTLLINIGNLEGKKVQEVIQTNEEVVVESKLSSKIDIVKALMITILNQYSKLRNLDKLSRVPKFVETIFNKLKLSHSNIGSYKKLIELKYIDIDKEIEEITPSLDPVKLYYYHIEKLCRLILKIYSQTQHTNVAKAFVTMEIASIIHSEEQISKHNDFNFTVFSDELSLEDDISTANPNNFDAYESDIKSDENPFSFEGLDVSTMDNLE